MTNDKKTIEMVLVLHYTSKGYVIDREEYINNVLIHKDSITEGITLMGQFIAQKLFDDRCNNISNKLFCATLSYKQATPFLYIKRKYLFIEGLDWERT